MSGRDAPVGEAGTRDACVAEAIAELARAVAAARQLLSEGAMPDLGGLDQQVAEVCRGVEAMAPEAGRQHLPGLMSLAAALTALEADCRSWRAGMPPDPVAGLRGRAADAYGRKPDGR